MPVTLAQYFVAPKMARFLARYPELRLDITLKGGQIDPVAQRFDVVFQTMRPEVDSSFIQKRMITVELGIFGSPDYLSTAPPLRSPQDLAQHSCLTLTASREGTQWTLHRRGKTQDIRLRGRIAIGDPLVQQRLCLDGAGIAILPYWLIQDQLRKKQLLRVLPEWVPSPIELFALYPTRLSMTPKLNVFLAFIQDVVPKPAK
jgi:DNA-binding transcriptional LysR family regulator